MSVSVYTCGCGCAYMWIRVGERSCWLLCVCKDARSFCVLPLMSQVIHGDSDEVVPYSHGKALYDTISLRRDDCPPPLWIRGAGHNDLEAIAGEEFSRAIAAFLRSLKPL